MKSGRMGAVVRDCLRKNRIGLLLWGLTLLTELAVFLLYNVMLEPLAYAAALTLFIGLVLLAVEVSAAWKRARERQRLCEAVLSEWNDLPEAKNLEQADYGEMIQKLGRCIRDMERDYAAQREDMLDYYTTWVHQIKTPIAVMKLYLAEETPEHRAMSAELFRMEQYVDMVLQYLRLSSGENDLVIREYKLDALIREAVRKYAAQFVLKKLKLTYIPTEMTVVTDRKWFCCILEQLLSNAIKYTPAGGGIAIGIEGDALRISDTGIGIAPEDLPRIFEKGYTGINGRLERSASGLGLYLTRRAADMLHIPIRVESKVGRGTAFTLHLRQDG
jgi:signal transduction histidine kinase